jgi:microcystin degradation protein MlrC
MARIAVGGFQHETNTFAPVRADLDQFEQSDAWPGLNRGAALIPALAGMNIPASGFVALAHALGHALVPLSWCAATPSAHVTSRAFETVSGMLLEDLRAQAPVDAVYLDLHGAMVTENLEDGEGEILRRVRGIIGYDTPLVASLDLHANVTPTMVEHATALIAYRTYPHVDMAPTGERAARLLDRALGGERLYKAFRQLPFLIPITWQCTLNEPAASIMAAVRRLEQGPVRSVSFTPGFPPADIHHCGPAIVAYGTEPDPVERAADELADAVLRRECDFTGRLYNPDSAVRRAMAAIPRRGPVILADTQDNPGGGGNGDTVGILEALIRLGANGALLGLLYDPQAAAMAHRRGEGARIEIALGAKSGFGDEQPLRGCFTVEKLGDGRFEATGPFYRGCHMHLGPMALLRIGGVRVAVASRKQQAADRAMFRHLGLDPAAQRILVLKSSVHFRADFEPIAGEILVVKAPGPNVADPAELPYRRLRPGVRLKSSWHGVEE